MASDPKPAPAAPTSTATEPAAEPTATGDLNTCAGLVQDEGRSCYSRELAAIVNGAGDPLAAVEGITKAAYADQSGFLLANCHGIMHTVAREYALRTGLKLDEADGQPAAHERPGLLGRLRARPGHGGRARRSRRPGPTVANRLCANSETRYQRYSCTHGFGHAFMRLNNENIAPVAARCASSSAPAPRPTARRASTTTTGSR